MVVAVKRKGRNVREQFERWFKRYHPDSAEMARLDDGMDYSQEYNAYTYVLVDEAWRVYRAAFQAGRRSGGGSR